MIKEKFQSAHIKLRHLLYSILVMVVFSIVGQAVCDRLGTLKGIPYHSITLLLTFAEIAVLYAVIRFLSGKHRIIRVTAWILGVLMCLYMLFMSCALIICMPSPIEVYSAGWWLGAADKLEDEQRLWVSSHWIGHGDPYYEYDDSVVETPAETESQALEEPYHSAVNERARAETTYRYYYADTMLNVLSYLYGRWVWLVYLLITIAWIMMGLRASSLVLGIPLKLLYWASWLLFTISLVLPVLNGCGLCFSCYGPPFTGFFGFYWEYHLFIIGPALSMMISLAAKKA